ncbi:hypothetical protein MMC21_007955 [Puttea exsequens]|nr:hypothetical protein [Puttea exsequens]
MEVIRDYVPRRIAASQLAVFTTVILVGILYYVLSAGYALYFHPLARYPGPKLWIISRIPSARALRNGTFIHVLRKMHERYGPVVRYSEKELSFVDAQAWHDIYGHHGGKSNFPRNPIWYLRAPNGAHTILSADNTDHARMRRLLSHAFSERALKAQEHLIQVYFDLLINRLKAKAADDGKPFNIVDWFHFTTFDIAGDLEFGESFNCLEDGKLHPWIEVMLSHFKRLVILGSILIVFPLLRPIAPWLIPKNVTRQRLERFQFAHDKVGTRLAKGDDQLRADFMTYVCRYNDEKGMSRQEIDATFEILVSASSETTATALTGILHYLLKNPRQFAKLRDEIRGAFKNNEDITIISAARLTYLTAVINEGLRLCPPTPTMLPRLVPKGGASVCGKWLPGGTSVGVPQWSMFRHPSNFSLPDSFIPERWLPQSTGSTSPSSSPAEGLTHEPKAFQPFSYGPRNCLGKGLAWTELRIILSKLIWHFDVVDEGDTYDWADQRTFVMWEKKPLVVGLRTVQRQGA